MARAFTTVSITFPSVSVFFVQIGPIILSSSCAIFPDSDHSLLFQVFHRATSGVVTLAKYRLAFLRVAELPEDALTKEGK